jgi:hypothetical protein
MKNIVWMVMFGCLTSHAMMHPSHETEEERVEEALDEDVSIYIQALKNVTEKSFGRRYYMDANYQPNPLEADVNFLRHIDKNRESQRYFMRYSIWKQVLKELDRLRSEKK